MESCKHTQKDLISCMKLMLGSNYTLRRAMLRSLRWKIQRDYQYDIDVAEVAELWRRGSVVGSWLLILPLMYYAAI
jgi:6-phosphogluconate dehydrogenase (decarboxylating)